MSLLDLIAFERVIIPWTLTYELQVQDYVHKVLNSLDFFLE